MEKIEINHYADLTVGPVLTIKTKVKFFGRLYNLLINPFRYLLTGKVIY